MLAFLKLIPIKDYIYGAVIAALLAGFGIYTLHERHEGAVAIVAADTRTAAVAAAKDKSIEAATQAASNTIGTIYEKAVAVPAVADLGVLCVAPRGGSVSQAAGNQSGHSQAPLSGNPTTFDPSGAILTVGRDADAQINALIDEVSALTGAMNGAPK